MANNPFVVNLKNEPDTPEQIADKLNSRKYILNKNVINELLATQGDLDELRNNSVPKSSFDEYAAKTNKRVSDIYDVAADGRKKLTDSRFHGGGTTKRRVYFSPDGSPIALNADVFDDAVQNNTQISGTLTIVNPSGTAQEGMTIMYRIKCTNSQTFSFGSSFRGSSDLALPASTTGSSKNDYLGFYYNSNDSKWDLLAKVFGF